MESRSEIPIDKENLRRATSAFKNKLSNEFVGPLATILDQHKDGLRPLTGYYISAQKGRKNLSQKIAKDVTKKFVEVFAMDFVQDSINSPLLDKTLNTMEERGIGLGVDRRGNPKFNLDIQNFYKQYFVKFVIKKGIPPIPVFEKIIFETSFSGGLYDMQIIDALTRNRSLNLGDLGGDLMVSVIKLPFVKYEINQRMYDKYTSIPLKEMTVSIPNLAVNA